MRPLDNSPPSAASRPYLGHAVGEHVLPALYSTRAFYRWPAARRSNHDHGRMPFICACYDHSHMRHLVGSEARLRGEVPPEHIRFYVQEPATVAQTIQGRLQAGAELCKIACMGRWVIRAWTNILCRWAGAQTLAHQLSYFSTTRSDIKGLC